MGRRQNPAIEAYFERGQKLDDASNRYQQTCRRCGEFFARGRPENLIDHVARKCTVVTLEEREDFMNRYNANRSSLPRKSNAAGLDPSLPAVTPDVSALNALAEASRQHGHLRTSPTRETSQTAQASLDTSSMLEQLQQHAQSAIAYGAEALFLLFLHVALTSHIDADNGTSTSNTQATLANVNQTPNRDASSSSAPNTMLTQPSALQITALSALDPMLEHFTNGSVPLVDYAIPPVSQAQPEPGPSVPNANAPTFVGVAQKKVRGAFSEPRRMEVRNVRQKGACLRCRMLKKSCGEEDPCRECSKLENARLWKSACIRVRLTELFTIYQASLFRVTAHQAEQAVKVSGEFQPMAGRLEVTHFPESGVYLALPWIMTMRNVVLLSNESDSVSDKMKGYIFKILAGMQDNTISTFAISHFTQHTLNWATQSCDGSQVSKRESFKTFKLTVTAGQHLSEGARVVGLHLHHDEQTGRASRIYQLHGTACRYNNHNTSGGG